MTSFLALRASVCAYLWCLVPPVCYMNRHPPVPTFNSSVSCWKPSRKREVPSSNPGRPSFFLHLNGLNFALDASYESNSSTQAGAWCVVRFFCSFFVTGNGDR